MTSEGPAVMRYKAQSDYRIIPINQYVDVCSGNRHNKSASEELRLLGSKSRISSCQTSRLQNRFGIVVHIANQMTLSNNHQLHIS
ncbi:hypothetical protein CEXT_369421 [Caerostris extrusa]|uniref:Uncharacterized protein n=1 Tax=Caerostris extrusa TaxID=172846 RepID=A0AAV4SN83_CAEEX|nr:hypothetical protein CEXT_369421 [Caerostris extrusa]